MNHFISKMEMTAEGHRREWSMSQLEPGKIRTDMRTRVPFVESWSRLNGRKTANFDHFLASHLLHLIVSNLIVCLYRPDSFTGVPATFAVHDLTGCLSA